MLEFLVLIYSLETGYMPTTQTWNVQAPENVYIDAAFYTDLEVELVLGDMFFIGGNMLSYQWFRPDTMTFRPHRMDYTFGVGFRFQGLEIGWEHYCSHPVAANWHLIDELPLESSYDRIYVRFEGKAAIFN
jgi:hypothetical protein